MNDEALQAVKKGNLKKLKELLDQGININAQDNCGRTYLHHAASNRKSEVIEYLLQNDADVLITTDKNNTALHIAISIYDGFDESAIVETLLKNVARNKLRQLIDAKSKASGTTALHVAAKRGLSKSAFLLLEYGGNFEIENDAGEKPIDLTRDQCLREFLRIIELNFVQAKNGDEQLIVDYKKRKSNLNNMYVPLPTLYCRNNDGHTIMQVLIVNMHDELAEELSCLRCMCATGDNFEWMYGRDRVGEIDKLAERIEKFEEFWSERLDDLRVLVNSGNQIDDKFLRIHCRVLKGAHEVFLAYRQFSGETSLTSSAAMKTLEDVLEYLDFEPDQLYTARSIGPFSMKIKTIRLTLAVNDGHVARVQQLLGNRNSGEYIGLIDPNKRTVLGYAAENGNKTIVSLLLKAGERVIIECNRPDINVITPVYLAANRGHAKIVKLLLKNVDNKDILELVDCQNGGKPTALHAAAKKGHLDVVKILLSYGATYEILDEKNRTPLDVSNKEDVSAFLKIVDECFRDAREANDELVFKLKALQTDEFMAVTNTRNNKGQKLVVVAATAGAKNVAAYILKMIKEKKQSQT